MVLEGYSYKVFKEIVILCGYKRLKTPIISKQHSDISFKYSYQEYQYLVSKGMFPEPQQQSKPSTLSNPLWPRAPKQ